MMNFWKEESWGTRVKMVILATLFISLLFIAWMQTTGWCGDKEEFELKLQNFNLQAQSIGLQKQLLIKDMDQWKKLDEQLAELNKQVQAFQRDLDTKGFMVNEQGKLVDKPKEKAKDKPAEKK